MNYKNPKHLFTLAWIFILSAPHVCLIHITGKSHHGSSRSFTPNAISSAFSLALGLFMVLAVLLFLPSRAQSTDGDIRFANGNNGDQIEIEHNGVWKAVCDDNWSTPANEDVACKHLSFEGGTNSNQAFLGQSRSSGDYAMDDLECVGNERKLTECVHAGLGVNDCGANKAVAVMCDGTRVTEVLAMLYNSTGGANWKNDTNWLSNEEIGSWHGVETNSEGTVYNISLTTNNLSGTIPPELETLSGLTRLSFQNNKLSGTIPPELGNLSNLTTLNLRMNQVSGMIPTKLGELTELVSLFLNDNKLSGTIPTKLGELTELVRLYLHKNQLNGTIPAELGMLSKLTDLSLGSNQLSGMIPTKLGELTKLVLLSLSDNQLTGEIPAELGMLSNLWYLYLHNNQLTGEIPAELGMLSKLTDLNLHGNQLNGAIPAELGMLSKLSYLYLHNNQLTEEIPIADLEKLDNLWELALWGNEELTGNIPNELGKRVDRAALQSLHRTNGGPEWTNDTRWLSDANPFAFSQWYGVEVNSDGRVSQLNLSNNGLKGNITDSLEALEGLEVLDISNNSQLTGKLPTRLRHLPISILKIQCTGVSVPDDADFKTWLSGIDDFQETCPPVDTLVTRPVDQELEDTEEDMEGDLEEDPETEPELSSGGGGCAVASNADSGNTPRSNTFNLFLIVSAMLMAVSLSRNKSLEI